MSALIIVLIGLAGWEALVRLGGVDELILPAPTQVLDSLWTDRSILAPDLATTTWEVLFGLAVAIAAGALLGIAMHVSPRARRALRPLVIGSQAVPVPVIAPLVILVLGFGMAPKVLLIALVCFFPVAINLYDGLRDTDADARKLLRSLDATRWQTLRMLELPSALPATFTGVKIAAAVAVIGAVFAEWAGSDAGLGHALLTANGQLATARAFAATLLLFLLAVVLYGAFALARAARRRLDPALDSRRTMTRLVLLLALLTAVVAGCGEKSDAPSAGSGKTEKLTVMLDWFPNADHAGLYAAQASGEYERAGLDVKFVTPSDAATPLKLLQAGRVDLAMSYQPDVLLARDQGADVVAVGALVQKPLTSLMSLGAKGVTEPKQLAGKTVGTAGIPYQSAYLKTILDKAGVDPARSRRSTSASS